MSTDVLHLSYALPGPFIIHELLTLPEFILRFLVGFVLIDL